MPRREVQIAQDLIRYVNIMNDIVDVASMHLKEQDDETGEKYQHQAKDATVKELKARVKRDCQNANGYKLAVNSFLAKADRSAVDTGLAVFGTTLAEIETDVQGMTAAVSAITAAIDKKTTKQELKALSKEIDDNVQKLVLVRRTWCIGD